MEVARKDIVSVIVSEKGSIVNGRQILRAFGLTENDHIIPFYAGTKRFSQNKMENVANHSIWLLRSFPIA